MATIPPARGLPLWPLPLLCAALPFVAAHLAWWLSLADGLIPACNPYLDGCVSISRAARHGLGNHVFRMAMLPAATLQALCWLAAAGWLRRRWGVASHALPWLGLVAAAFLALYATFLGTEGEAYRLLRSYGVKLYFGASYLALLVLLRAMARAGRPQGRVPAGYGPLLGIALGMLAIGLASVAREYAVLDDAANDAWGNVLEWQLGLWLTAMFAVLAWRWWRDRVRIALA
jgi:hypothetical protein